MTTVEKNNDKKKVNTKLQETLDGTVCTFLDLSQRKMKHLCESAAAAAVFAVALAQDDTRWLTFNVAVGFMVEFQEQRHLFIMFVCCCCVSFECHRWSGKAEAAVIFKHNIRHICLGISIEM